MKINPSTMGDVYDDFAKAFREADALPTWKWVGRGAMESLLGPSFKEGATFLDLGSASARVEAGVLIPNGVKPGNITGVEISPDQVEMAKTRIPGAHFVVGDISVVELPQGAFDVAFSHMVFEHLDDAQLLATCKNAYRALKPGATFAFVVTHPDKMTDLNGNLVIEYGAFETTAPWGGVLQNWRRSVSDTVRIVEEADFKVESAEDVAFPTEAPANLAGEELAEFIKNREKYKRYPAIRLAIRATKPV